MWYEDICFEKRTEGLYVALIHSKPVSVPSQKERINCLLLQIE
jgi:hypothetical protein